MFGWFKKKSTREKLMEEYTKLKEEAFKLSSTNRTESDAKLAQAELILSKIDSLVD
jgi:hypothetical protein